MSKVQIEASLKLWRWRKNRYQERINAAHKVGNHKEVERLRVHLQHAVDRIHLRERQLKAIEPSTPLLWMPGAIHHPLPDAGSFVEGYEPKGLLHTTESHGDATATLASKNAAPNYEVLFTGGIIQYIANDRAGRALEHNGWAETNRGNCRQIEIANFAAHGGEIDNNHPQFVALRNLMRFIESNCGVARVTHVKFPSNGQGVRLTEHEWVGMGGWLGHMHAPLNSHWDPGGIEMDKFDVPYKPL